MAISDQERTRGPAGRFGQEPPRHPLTKVGKMFERVRVARGLSHAEISAQAGVGSASTWNTVIYGGRYQKGEFKRIKSSPETIRRYAFALGLNVDEALKAAGFTPVPSEIQYNLEVVPSRQLWLELCRRNELPKAQRERITRKYGESDTPSRINTTQ